jgi:DNA-binding transcriptional ArsR family regulator
LPIKIVFAKINYNIIIILKIRYKYRGDKMEDTVIRLTADLLKTLAHPVRLQVLKLLASNEKCVCQLIEDIGIEQSNLSQHLRVLKRQGLVDSRKDGTMVFYRLVNLEVLDIMAAAEQILSGQISQRQMLLRHLTK